MGTKKKSKRPESASDERLQKTLKQGLRALVIAFLVATAIVGYSVSLKIAVLMLACGALLLVIGLFWSSLQNLTGEAPLTLTEAMGLAAPTAEEEQKRAILRTLKDLEYERSVGKISEEDYRELSARYRAEAKRILQSLDENLLPLRDRAQALLDKRLKKAGLFNATKSKNDDADSVGEGSDDADSADAATDDVDDTEARESSPTPSKRSDDLDDDEQEPDAPAEQAVACKACGADNDADAAFCKRCGKPMEASS